MRYNPREPRLPKFRATFFRTAAGAEPVREWLMSLPKHERRDIGRDIAYVQYKWPIGKPRVDYLRGGVWEIRSRLENRIARVLFAVSGQEIVLLHGSSRKRRRQRPTTSAWPSDAGRSGSMAKRNKHRGSSFDRFLHQQGMYQNVQAAAVKRAVVEAIEDGMQQAGLSKNAMAKRMRTSRSQLDRVLDPEFTAVQLDSVVRAAAAIGQELRISFKKSAQRV